MMRLIVIFLQTVQMVLIVLLAFAGYFFAAGMGLPPWLGAVLGLFLGLWMNGSLWIMSLLLDIRDSIRNIEHRIVPKKSTPKLKSWNALEDLDELKSLNALAREDMAPRRRPEPTWPD